MGTDWHVSDAGLVLVARFLPALFETIGLTRDGVFVSKAACHQGAHLLEVAAAGDDSAAISDARVSRIMCGLNPEVSVLQESIPQARLDELDTMLDAVVKHWDVGDLSMAALRNQFLSRQGLLKNEAEQWHLEVAHSSQDVLIDSLPWPISLVRLSWMQSPIVVDWA